MTIREKYNILTTYVRDDKLIDMIKGLRDQCLLEQNKEYLYLCNLLIIDIYIEMNKLDEVLALIAKDINQIDTITFSQIYVSYLERIIYVYINKRNFTVAYKYVFEKRKFIDDKNRDDVNRWYLEMAYIYAEMNQHAKAVDNLKSIIENLPSDELLSLTLANLTKLYIDQNMVKEAKVTLNNALEVTTDEDGKIYCQYLFAKISLLEEKYDEALLIFNEFLENKESQYINITNDYLDLLIKMDKLKEARAFVNKINKSINQSEDLALIKEFNKNKLKLILLEHNIPEGLKVQKYINSLEKTMIKKDSLVFEEAFEDDKNNEVFIRLKKIIEKIEHVISLTDIAFTSNNLRDLLMEFSKKIEMSIAFDDITYVLFDQILPFFNDGKLINIYNYKKNRLYERSVDYDRLKDSAVEVMMTSGNDVVFDFSESSLPLIDVFSGEKYIDLEVKFLVGIGANEDDNLFMTVLYRTKHLDITTIENTIILKIITKLLSSKIYNLYIQERNRAINFFNDKIIDHTNLFTIIHKNDKLALSDNFASLLGFKNNLVSLNDFSKKIVKSDINKYRDAIENKLVEEVSYRLIMNDGLVLITENMYYYENDGFKFSIIKIDNEENDITPNDEEFENKISELKSHVNDLEFKFSLIRLDANINNYDELKSIFGVSPYYLSDGTFVIILENEVNQRTLDKYIANLKSLTIVRYPRDLINIDDIIKYSKISLSQGILYFTDDIYQKYLRKVSINNLVEKMLEKPVELWYLELNSYNNKPSYEVKCNINGLSNKENIRDYLEPQTLYKYESILYKSLGKVNPKINYYLSFSTQTIEKLLNEGKINNAMNMNFCLFDYNDNIINIITSLNQLGIKVFLHYKLLEQISISDFNQVGIVGIVINEGLQKNVRDNLLAIASAFTLTLITNYEFNDYEKIIYKTEEMKREV